MRPLFVIQRRAERASLKIKSYALTHSRQRGAKLLNPETFATAFLTNEVKRHLVSTDMAISHRNAQTINTNLNTKLQ